MILQTFRSPHFSSYESNRNTKTVQQKHSESFKMFQALERLGDKYPHITNQSPEFLDNFLIFKNKVAVISATLKEEDTEKKKREAKKNSDKEKICKAGADIAGLLLINMKTINIISLKPEVNMFHTELMRTRDETLLPRIQDIHDSGVAGIKILTQYGITISLLNAFQEMINDYFNPVYPREFAQKKIELNKKYRLLFKEADMFIKEHLDKTISLLRKKNPQFVHAYKDLKITKTK